MDKKFKVFLIDDHALFRKGVSQMISADPAFEVVGEASSGLEGLELAPQIVPDIVLIDLNMKGVDGLETLRRFKSGDLPARFVVLTVSDAEDDLLEALRAGADGYLLKDMDPEQLCDSLKKILGGMTVIQDRLTEVLKQALQELAAKPAPVSPDQVSLTEREHEILQCLADGLSNKAIARKLGISDTTVKVHVKHLLSKLRLTSRLEAAVWAHRQK
ncbi:two-component system response regulator NarL [Methylobacillus caricis]|uniref:two-component system response regulator NarL n=1 Tax=Methylobacillus caricis TaxID=1971611 RepID=UPI001CFF62E6|nr:two-component system response regulator NarL [Methylobacillus caricis]MCB5186547.1 two-component system response regulator NarL [Methylobacillus caricis]